MGNGDIPHRKILQQVGHLFTKVVGFGAAPSVMSIIMLKLRFNLFITTSYHVYTRTFYNYTSVAMVAQGAPNLLPLARMLYPSKYNH